MGVLDKFLDVMKLNDDEDFDDEEFFEDDDYYEDEKPQKKSLLKRGRAAKSDDYDDDFEDEPAPARKSTSAKQLPARAALPDKSVPAVRQNARRGSEMEVCVMRPTAVEDSRTIAETLLGNRTVVLNLEGLEIEVAQRIIDFVSGATYALDGNLQKVSQYIFLITPTYVDISGDLNNLFGDTAGTVGGQY